MKQGTFTVHSARLRVQLVAVAVQVVLLCIYILVWRQGWWEVAKQLGGGVVGGLAVGPLSCWVFGLPSWSVRSHLLAVAHGMIPRRSSTSAQWSWLVPGVNLFVPFAMLHERWRFYRCVGKGPITPIRSAQILFGLALLMLLLQQGTPEALVLAGIFGGWSLLELRRAVGIIAAAQIQAELHATAEHVFG